MKNNSMIENMDEFFNDYNRLAKNKSMSSELEDFEYDVDSGEQEDGIFAVYLCTDDTIDRNSYEFAFRVSTDEDTGVRSAAYVRVAPIDECLQKENVFYNNFDEFTSDLKRVALPEFSDPETCKSELMHEIECSGVENRECLFSFSHFCAKDGLDHKFVFYYSYDFEANTSTFTYKGVY